MAKRSETQIKAKTAMAQTVVEHHFGRFSGELEFKPTGQTNFVFDVRTSQGDFIVRIGSSQAKLDNFIKEQWATEKALEHGVPVPEILEVGSEIIGLPYMLQKKIDGQVALDHPDRLEILTALGKHACQIHTIKTHGFGDVFDWSRNKLSKKKTWIAYLEEELQVAQRLKFLEHHRILTRKKVRHLAALVDKIKTWNMAPSLNHCDLRLKNVIVDRDGKILAIIDWENCSSNIAPYWDLSIALHDLSIDGKQKFLEGYGLDFATFSRNAYALTVFNLLNYIPALHELINRNNQKMIELYKLRLNGSLDLFSL
jgi:aminoglycoside phosphotransferase (APT) family kinase protein